MTASAIGIIMKELVRRAIGIAEGMVDSFIITEKVGLNGQPDVFTDADTAAQKHMAGRLRENFPKFGIIGEEDGLNVVRLINGKQVFFTIDPIDGTKAWTRQQSHGVGVMISLVIDGVVVAAFVGDINTKEIYGYRPESTKVHRLRAFGPGYVMKFSDARQLDEQYLLVRDRIEKLMPAGQRWAHQDGPFKDITMADGSIGISMARLWKGEVGAAILRQENLTLWDMCPIWGISRMMGFVFLDTATLEPYEYHPDGNQRTVNNPHELIVVHQNHVAFLREVHATLF